MNGEVPHEQQSGKRLPLSPARRAIAEMLHHAQRVPTVPVSKQIDVGDLAQLRKSGGSAPSWTAVFMRAYSLVGMDYPALRRMLIPWPYPHLYEHPYTICKLAVERHWQDELVPLMSEIHYPEEKSLELIQEKINYLKYADIQTVGAYRQLLRFGSLPAPLRRLAAWKMLYTSGLRRARRMGTFGLSNYGQLGAESLHPISPLTTLLTLGPVAPDGHVTVKLVYDHRVIDGSFVARCLNHLEQVLHSTIRDELRLAVTEGAETARNEPVCCNSMERNPPRCAVSPQS